MAKFTCPNCGGTVSGYSKHKANEHKRVCETIGKLEEALNQARKELGGRQSRGRGAGASPQRIRPPRTAPPRDDRDEQIVDQSADTANDAASIVSEHETEQRIASLETEIATMKQRIEREAQSSREASNTDHYSDDWDFWG